MRLFTKQELIEQIKSISAKGWHHSTKRLKNTRNDGAVGNTLEHLLGISENNLPIPNSNDWELKGQRSESSSLITLKHMEPSPRGANIVPQLLLKMYGWTHGEAGKKYPSTEKSFRSTTSGKSFTVRGFKIVVDRKEEKIKFVFDYSKVDVSDPSINQWLETVKKNIGLGPLNPEPYWGFNDLNYAIGSKIKNCFYVIADSKLENGQEFFHYKHLYVLSGFAFERFLKCIEDGLVLVDFDARTGHNHGTKFRTKQGCWTEFYSEVKQVF
jgi:hypothetical protein